VSVSNTLCGQNLELLNVKLRGIYSDWVETPHLRRTENTITVGKNYVRVINIDFSNEVRRDVYVGGR
jgi:hypothetical protein